jgi:hypothetical protein
MRAPFSGFVTELIWGNLTSPLGFQATIRDFAGRVGPPLLDYLAENFEELSRKSRLGRRNPFLPGGETELWEIRYFDEAVRIRVVADGNPTIEERAASWAVHADGEAPLFAALQQHWPFCGLRWEFLSNDEEDEGMARRFASPM